MKSMTSTTAVTKMPSMTPSQKRGNAFRFNLLLLATISVFSFVSAFASPSASTTTVLALSSNSVASRTL